MKRNLYWSFILSWEIGKIYAASSHTSLPFTSLLQLFPIKSSTLPSVTKAPFPGSPTGGQGLLEDCRGELTMK